MLGGALMRLCESARVDSGDCAGAIAAWRRGSTRLNARWSEKLNPLALSTMLVRGALEINPADDPATQDLPRRPPNSSRRCASAGADVLTSARAGRRDVHMAAGIDGGRARARARPKALDDDGTDDAQRSHRQRSTVPRAAKAKAPKAIEGDGATARPIRTCRWKSRASSQRRQGGRPLTSRGDSQAARAGRADQTRRKASGGAEGEGMYLTQLTGKQAQELEQMREQLGEIGTMSGHGRLVLMHARNQDSYYSYDEWDYVLADYRRNWCRLREVPLAGDDGDFFAQDARSATPRCCRRCAATFSASGPRRIGWCAASKTATKSTSIALVETRVARLMGEIPDARVYSARKKEVARRRHAVPARHVGLHRRADSSRAAQVHDDDDDHSDDWMKAWQRRPQQSQRPRRIIDVNKEALVIMAQALEEIGDSYAIMGFSGHGRDNVEFYVIKEFDQELTDEVKARVGAVEPKRSTRMGAAIRHVREKFKDVSSRAKHMILLSDGFPQDFDYGHDRRSNAYGIQDTMVALKELEMAGVLPFCITVDRTGHDYLRQMCAPSRYLVIEDITSLPRSCRRSTSRSSAGRIGHPLGAFPDLAKN